MFEISRFYYDRDLHEVYDVVNSLFIIKFDTYRIFKYINKFNIFLGISPSPTPYSIDEIMELIKLFVQHFVRVVEETN